MKISNGRDEDIFDPEKKKKERNVDRNRNRGKKKVDEQPRE